MWGMWKTRYSETKTNFTILNAQKFKVTHLISTLCKNIYWHKFIRRFLANKQTVIKSNGLDQIFLPYMKYVPEFTVAIL